MSGARFEGKVALITGAGQGIGLATARLMGLEGAQLVLIERDPLVLKRAVSELQAAGIQARGTATDVLVESEVEAAVHHALAAFGRIDVLVNAVGGSTAAGKSTAPLDALTLDEFEATLRFNLSGTFLCCHAAIPAMKRQRSGKIVNVASIAARGTAFSNAAYSAAKAGIVALTTKLALELASHGVLCNAIAPGLTLTERMTDAMKGFSAAELERRAAQIPLGRFSTSLDQAKAVCFLASSDADFITGSTLYVTGGA